MLSSASCAFAALTLLSTAAKALLSGPVGPTTSTVAKRTKICNVLEYGGVVNSSDIGPAIGAAFSQCVVINNGSTLYVPPGNYNMSTWQVLEHGSNWAFQMDGVITRSGAGGGHMILIQNANDFEMYSSTSAGAFQGLGYQCRWAGPRFLRMVSSTNWSLHDLMFVDSPSFHVIVDGGSNGEIYNLVIRGASIGGTDGIDISGNNHWVHDVEVSNRDECVTTKSPASNFLVERIWCNQSGGSAIGSLPGLVAISNITYRNVYTNGGNQMFMIKSNGGEGSVQNVHLKNFIGHGTAYGLDVNQYWGPVRNGSGVLLNNITFENWAGQITSPSRPPIDIMCNDLVPCTNITLKNVKMGVANMLNATMQCKNAYGHGACLVSPGATGVPAYTTVVKTVRVPGMVGDLAQGFATDAPIPIPTIPCSFYPGLPQTVPLAKNRGM